MIDTKELRQSLGAVQPEEVAVLLDRLEAAEKERDNYKVVYEEWIEKTEWVQRGINDGAIPPKYLGWHRVDVVADLLSVAEKEAAYIKEVEFPRKVAAVAVGWETKCARLEQERDALRAEVERLTECLHRANAQAEHFEREWYLRGDEVDALRARWPEWVREQEQTATEAKP